MRLPRGAPLWLLAVLTCLFRACILASAATGSTQSGRLRDGGLPGQARRALSAVGGRRPFRSQLTKFRTTQPYVAPGPTQKEQEFVSRVRNMSAAAHPLPDAAHAAGFKRRLQERCQNSGGSGGKMRMPPEEIVVAGMPNTGTNALTSYLKAHLDAKVEGQPPRIWKHLPPYHPKFEDFITQGCAARRPPAGIVFTVRNPVTWMLSQTSPGHNFGHSCFVDEVQRRPEVPFWFNFTRSCTFFACDVLSSPPCGDLPEPRAWKFPTLLDLWAAYALNTPILPNAMVVRYEDLLNDREAVLHGVADHFGVQVKEATRASPDPLKAYSRAFDKIHRSSSGFQESQRRMHSFEDLWSQFGLSPFGFPAAAPRQGGSIAPSPDVERITCKRGDEMHHYIHTDNLEALQSAAERGVLEEALKLHDYEVPSPAQAKQASEQCWTARAAALRRQRLNDKIRKRRRNPGNGLRLSSALG